MIYTSVPELRQCLYSTYRLKIRNAIVAEKAVVPPNARIGYDSDADLSQFPVSEKGIVIVGASRPDMPHVPRESIHAMKARQSMTLVSRRQK